MTTATLPDLVVANQSSDSISVILNSSNVSVTPNAPLTSYPGSEYVDLGLKVHATPRLHPNHEVTLDLQFDISAVSGQNVNGIPVLTNRTIAQSVRLRDDQTSVLSGIIQRSDVRSINGWPGLGEAGPIGYLFGVHGKQESDTELLIAITPRQLRLAARTDTTILCGPRHRVGARRASGKRAASGNAGCTARCPGRAPSSRRSGSRCSRSKCWTSGRPGSRRAAAGNAACPASVTSARYSSDADAAATRPCGGSEPATARNSRTVELTSLQIRRCAASTQVLILFTIFWPSRG